MLGNNNVKSMLLHKHVLGATNPCNKWSDKEVLASVTVISLLFNLTLAITTVVLGLCLLQLRKKKSKECVNMTGAAKIASMELCFDFVA